MLFLLFKLLISVEHESQELKSHRISGNHANIRHKKQILSVCPSQPPVSQETVVISSSGAKEFTSKLVYGCQQSFMSQGLKLTNCILRIYNSNFTNSNSDESAIHFNSKSISNQLAGNIEIEGCRFFKFHSHVGGSVYILSADPSRTITISNCLFDSNTAQQSEKGGAIYINAASVNIENSKFKNCYSKDGGCIYYTNDNNKQLLSTECSLKIHKCSFKNNKAKYNGGCLFLSTENGRSNGLIEITKCRFTSSQANDSTKGQGAGIYISSNEDNRHFRIIDCIFGRCHASTNGGAIYFDAMSGDIKGCSFTNNDAKDGCEVFSKKGEKLTITENAFVRNSITNAKRNSPDSLIFATFGSRSKIEFTNNKIKIDDKLNKVVIFSYPEGTSLTKDQLRMTDNSISSAFEDKIESKKAIRSIIDTHAAFIKADPECNEPSPPFDEISDNHEGDYTNTILYACDKSLKKAISAENKVLRIISCKFTNFAADNGGSIIQINISDQISATGTTEISNCKFIFNQRSSIYIESNQQYSFSVKECVFQNTQISGTPADNKKGISIASIGASINIDGCSFLNNDAQNGYYDVYYTKNDKDAQLNISKCTFGRNTEATNPFFFFTKGSRFTFNDNKIMTPMKISVVAIDTDKSIDDKELHVFNDNCLYSLDANLVSDKFTDYDIKADECPDDASCPPEPEDSVFIILCELDFSESNVEGLENIVIIHSCHFASCTNSIHEEGGAIYITTSSGLSTYIDPIEIINCDFNSCSARSGGAIYIKSNEVSRVFNIQKCTFLSNSITDNTNNGAAIFIYSGFSIVKITECQFVSNNGPAAAITFLSDSNYKVTEDDTNNNEKALYVYDCMFKANSATSLGGDIFILIGSVQQVKSIEINKCEFIGNGSNRPTNGGAIYIDIIESANEIDLKIDQCTFSSCSSENKDSVHYKSLSSNAQFHLTNCHIQEYGIVFDAFSGTINNCQFSNLLDGGHAIIYDKTSGSQNNELSLTIDTCEFSQSTGIDSLVYFETDLISKFVFTNNNINIENQITRAFGCASFSFSDQDKWEISNNNINPSEEIFIKTEAASKIPAQCDMKAFLCENEEPPEEDDDHQCPAPLEGSTNISDDKQDYESGDVYGCYINTNKYLKVNAQLHIYYCQFINVIAQDQLGAVSISGENVVEIKGCTFYNCKKTALVIESTKTSEIDIKRCLFEQCKAADQNTAGAIHLKSYANIQYCHFLNNFCDDGAIGSVGDILVDTSASFIITRCVFDRKNPSKDIDGGDLISITTSTNLEFTYNEINIHEEIERIRLFKGDQFPAKSTFKFNKISFLFREDIVPDSIKSKFKVQEKACPNKPDNFNCEVHSSDAGTEGPSLSSCTLVYIYYSVFYDLKNVQTNNGGAVYISTNNLEGNEPIKIYNSDFYNCQSYNGGAIYIESSEASRLFEISECTFYSQNIILVELAKDTSNKNEINNYYGGAIYIKSPSSSFKITKCSFDYNRANEGGCIYYISSQPTSPLNVGDENDFSLIITECKFSNNYGYSNGGAVSVSVKYQEAQRAVDINDCIFIHNIADHHDGGTKEVAEYGGAIYYLFEPTETAYSKKLLDTTSDARNFGFRVIDCRFEENAVSQQGGAIYISNRNKESPKSAEVTHCHFYRNLGKPTEETNNVLGSGSDIYYHNSASTGSDSTDPLLHISQCDFTEGESREKGGSIMISIESGEPSKSIEITECTFVSNKAFNENDRQSSYGGAIYYNFAPTTTYRSLLDTKDATTNYALHVFDCQFKGNSAKNDGGSIYLTIKKNEPSKPIDIESCIFDGDSANQGGSIYYSFDSATSSESPNFSFRVIDSKFTGNKAFNGGDIFYTVPSSSSSSAEGESTKALDISGCNFSLSEPSNYGGSIYLSINKDVKQSFEISQCEFDSCKSLTGKESIYLESTIPTVNFLISNCLFKKYGIKVDSYSANIKECQFNLENSDAPCAISLYHKPDLTPSYQSNSKILIYSCNFTQSEGSTTESYIKFDITGGQIYFNFELTNGNISILSTDKTKALGSAAEISVSESDKSRWTFSNNYIDPPEDSFIKTTEAEQIPAYCDMTTFMCSVPSPSEEPPDIEESEEPPEPEGPECPEIEPGFTNISDNFQSEYTDTNIYGCNLNTHDSLLVTNCILRIYHSQFINTKKTAISISLESTFSGEGPIEIKTCTFFKCTGTPIKAVSTVDSITFNIYKCHFEICQVSSDGNDKSAAIYINAKSASIRYCRFLNNFVNDKLSLGLVEDIYYDYNPGDEQIGTLSIKNCRFEDKLDEEYESIGAELISFTQSTQLEFRNNEIIIHHLLENRKLFVEANINKDHCTFYKNIIYPYREGIVSEEIMNIRNAFPTVKKECPDLPNGFSCEIGVDDSGDYLDKGEGPNIKTHGLINIYNCVFSYLQNKYDDFGGAIYISTNSSVAAYGTNEPVRIYNSDFYMCESHKGGAIFIQSTEASRLFEIFECTFISQNDHIKLAGTEEINKYSGGAIYIDSPSSSFRITQCSFGFNEANDGGCIYYISSTPDSSDESLLYNFSLIINECRFYSNRGYSTGGAVSIFVNHYDSQKSVEIDDCIFVGNAAEHDDGNKDEELPEYGGAIYYQFDASLTDATVKQNNFGFRVIDCRFESNVVSREGGSIYVTINNQESPKSVEIVHNHFYSNEANNRQELDIDGDRYGFASDIHYHYKATAKTESTNPSLQITQCDFAESVSNNKAGSVAISIDSGEPRSIGIDLCTFYKCSSISKESLYLKSSVPAPGVSISNCEFDDYGILIDAYSATIEDCRFHLTNNGGANAIHYSISNQGEEYHADSKIVVNRCNFTQDENANITSFVFYENDKVSSKFEFTNNNITMSNESTRVLGSKNEIPAQDTILDHWSFLSNYIYPVDGEYIKTEFAKNIPAYCGEGFLCEAPSSSEEESSDESKSDESSLTEEEGSSDETASDESSLTEEEGSSDETASDESKSDESSLTEEEPSIFENATEPLPGCDWQIDFNNSQCTINGSDYADRTFIEIYTTRFNGLNDNEYGAAIRLYNFGIYCHETNFTSCTAKGGGAVYIYLENNFKGEESVLLFDVTFIGNTAIFGGALYVYAENEEQNIRILSSKFERNKANKTPPTEQDKLQPHLYGGSAVYLQAKTSNISDCSFKLNVGSGVKIYNTFNQNQRSIKSIDSSSIQISNCLFESNEDSSLFYVREDKKTEVPVEVNDCIFTGDLPKGVHHIDGTSLSNKNEKSKLFIQSCMFSSDYENAVNTKSSLLLSESFNKDSQQFNYTKSKSSTTTTTVNDKEADIAKKQSSAHSALSVVVAAICLTCVALTCAIAFFVKRNNRVEDNHDDNEDIFDLNKNDL